MTDDPKGAITRANAVFAEAVAAQSAADVVALYTEDAIVLPPGLAPVIGHEAIQDWFTTAFGLGITWIELMTDMVRQVNDTIAVEQGRYRIGASQEAVTDAGSYTVYWRCEDDAWRIMRDVIVSAADAD